MLITETQANDIMDAIAQRLALIIGTFVNDVEVVEKNIDLITEAVNTATRNTFQDICFFLDIEGVEVEDEEDEEDFDYDDFNIDEFPQRKSNRR